MSQDLKTLKDAGTIASLPTIQTAADSSKTKTEVGNYFVATYPPFSQWKPEYIPRAIEALNQPPRVEDPLGLYLHIPFCRKRCKVGSYGLPISAAARLLISASASSTSSLKGSTAT